LNFIWILLFELYNSISFQCTDISMELSINQYNTEITPFLNKLIALTSNVESEIACWDEEGKTFVIKNGIKFEIYLRNYFKGRLLSFIRQLHFYGFSKYDLLEPGPCSWCFSHPLFLKYSPHLIKQITRRESRKPSDSPTSSSSNNNNNKSSSNKSSKSSVSPKIKQEMNYGLDLNNITNPELKFKQSKMINESRMIKESINESINDSKMANESINDNESKKEIENLKKEIKILQESVAKLEKYMIMNIEQHDDFISTTNKKRKLSNSNDSITIISQSSSPTHDCNNHHNHNINQDETYDIGYCEGEMNVQSHFKLDIEPTFILDHIFQ